MREIPKEIADRLTFETTSKTDPTLYVTNVKPASPCDCGKILDKQRFVRIAKNVEPIPHWREYCHSCNRASVFGENSWHTSAELNLKLRALRAQKNK